MNNCQLFLLEVTGYYWIDFNDSFILYSQIINQLEVLLILKMIEYKILYHDPHNIGGSIEVKKSHILQHIREQNINKIINES